jgi:FkbM family methyltransferase
MDTLLYDLGKFKMVLDRSDSDISEQIENYGWYDDERFVTEVFATKISEGMTVLDLGGNIGFYTLFARSIVGPSGKVISFEPFPKNVSLIKASVKENSFDNVLIVKAAVSNKVGKAFLFLSPDYNSEHSLLDLGFNYSDDWDSPKKIPVNVTTVDDYLKKNEKKLKVDFIKMDIEGAEYFALEGMQQTILQNDKLTILSEFWPEGFTKNKIHPLQFLTKLEELGFSIQHIDSLEHMVYPTSPTELMEICYARNKNSGDIYTKLWGWYTNILAIK